MSVFAYISYIYMVKVCSHTAYVWIYRMGDDCQQLQTGASNSHGLMSLAMPASVFSRSSTMISCDCAQNGELCRLKLQMLIFWSRMQLFEKNMCDMVCICRGVVDVHEKKQQIVSFGTCMCLCSYLYICNVPVNNFKCMWYSLFIKHRNIQVHLPHVVVQHK